MITNVVSDQHVIRLNGTQKSDVVACCQASGRSCLLCSTFFGSTCVGCTARPARKGCWGPAPQLYMPIPIRQSSQHRLGTTCFQNDACEGQQISIHDGKLLPQVICLLCQVTTSYSTGAMRNGLHLEGQPSHHIANIQACFNTVQACRLTMLLVLTCH